MQSSRFNQYIREFRSLKNITDLSDSTIQRITTSREPSSLLLAAQFGRLNVMAFLLEKGLPIEAPDTYIGQYFPLAGKFLASCGGNHLDYDVALDPVVTNGIVFRALCRGEHQLAKLALPNVLEPEVFLPFAKTLQRAKQIKTEQSIETKTIDITTPEAEIAELLKQMVMEKQKNPEKIAPSKEFKTHSSASILGDLKIERKRTQYTVDNQQGTSLIDDLKKGFTQAYQTNDFSLLKTLCEENQNKLFYLLEALLLSNNRNEALFLIIGAGLDLYHIAFDFVERSSHDALTKFLNLTKIKPGLFDKLMLQCVIPNKLPSAQHVSFLKHFKDENELVTVYQKCVQAISPDQPLDLENPKRLSDSRILFHHTLASRVGVSLFPSELIRRELGLFNLIGLPNNFSRDPLSITLSYLDNLNKEDKQILEFFAKKSQFLWECVMSGNSDINNYDFLELKEAEQLLTKITEFNAVVAKADKPVICNFVENFCHAISRADRFAASGLLGLILLFGGLTIAIVFYRHSEEIELKETNCWKSTHGGDDCALSIYSSCRNACEGFKGAGNMLIVIGALLGQSILMALICLIRMQCKNHNLPLSSQFTSVRKATAALQKAFEEFRDNPFQEISQTTTLTEIENIVRLQQEILSTKISQLKSKIEQRALDHRLDMIEENKGEGRASQIGMFALETSQEVDEHAPILEAGSSESSNLFLRML